jgi:hypothetical protein
MVKTKCNSQSTDSKTHKLRPCKAFSLSYSCQCVTHSRKQAIIIQSAWRGFYMKKKITLYKKLPPDVWNIVMFHLRCKHNVQHKLLPSYIKIYNKRQEDKLSRHVSDWENFDRAQLLRTTTLIMANTNSLVLDASIRNLTLDLTSDDKAVRT